MQNFEWDEWQSAIRGAEEEARRTRFLADLAPERISQGILEELAEHLSVRANLLRQGLREKGGTPGETWVLPCEAETYQAGVWRLIPAEWRQSAQLLRLWSVEEDLIWQKKLHGLLLESQNDWMMRLFLLSSANRTEGRENQRRPNQF